MRKRTVSQKLHRSNVLGPWNTIYPSNSSLQSWTCGLSGMPWPWKAWKCRRTPYTTQYFQIPLFSHRNSQFWAATKILWQNAPCQEPFFGAVPRSEQTARFGDMFFAGHFLFLDEIDPKIPQVRSFKDRFEGMKRFSNVRSMFWRMMKILLVSVNLPTDTQRPLTWTSWKIQRIGVFQKDNLSLVLQVGFLWIFMNFCRTRGWW